MIVFANLSTWKAANFAGVLLGKTADNGGARLPNVLTAIAKKPIVCR